MIPDKIEKVYYKISEASAILNISVWKLKNLLREMEKRHLIKISKGRYGAIRITDYQLNKLKGNEMRQLQK